MSAGAVFDAEARALHLLPGGRAGGEGTVSRIPGDPHRCAKIYHPDQLTRERAEKIRAMVENPPDDPTFEARGHRSLAWPEVTLYHDARRTQFAGFLMPLLDTRVFQASHTYYDPEDRLRRFGGGFTFRHLITVASNLASAVTAVHERGHRVGDLRETNLFVSPTALVTVLDCDSMQVRDGRSGEIFFARVGTGEYLPPELQGADFGRVDHDRTGSDRFALAVLVFKLLLNGVHPFQSRGPAVDDAPSTEAKIKKGLFPYAAGVRGATPPGYALPFGLLAPRLQELCLRCFVGGRGSAAARPAPGDWLEGLEEARSALVQCPRNPNHAFSNHLSACPWCHLAARTGKDHFPPPVPERSSASDPIAQRLACLQAFIEVALADGVIEPDERRFLERKAAELGIAAGELDRLIRQVARSGPRVPRRA